jgi:Fe-S oxidoreductase
VAQSAKNEPLYVKSLPDLTWKQLLDGDACTECGRCQDACPAHAAGTPLSPKQFILSIRQALHRDGRVLVSGKNNGQGGDQKLLGGEDISQDVLWSCTTCGACEAMPGS